MRLRWTTVVLAVVVLMFDSPWIFGQSSSAPSSEQTPKKSTSAQSAALTPQEKEAQKHYRIALEALKNSDLDTALDELNAAARLAPRNALIWYNLAVVESKRGGFESSMEHFKKAKSLGLPKSVQNEADQLEAKLSYEMERATKKKPDQINDGAKEVAANGPSLSETLNFLGRILPESEARATATRVYSDYRRYTQDRFIFGSPSACVFSWDNVMYIHFADGTPPWRNGKTLQDDRNREFISLKDVLLSDVKVMDLGAFAASQVGRKYMSLEQGNDVQFSGYSLVVKESDEVYTFNRGPIPNPYNVLGSLDTTNKMFFFASADDANRALKAIVHAATLCGAKADAF